MIKIFKNKVIDTGLAIIEHIGYKRSMKIYVVFDKLTPSIIIPSKLILFKHKLKDFLSKGYPIESFYYDLEIFHKFSKYDNIKKEDENIDIIIPIFNGYEYLDQLFSSIFNHTDKKHNIIIINDHSTDKRVDIFLEEIAKRKKVIYLKNERNLGFVRSVNIGLKLSKNNVVILNTDIELPADWLYRIVYPIRMYKNVASVTPISNSSTISSFPVIMDNNQLFDEMELDEIDSVFKRLNISKDIYFETPTGVGFCMAMSRKAIDSVGVFDEEKFGRGYGEENDWCLRCIKAGFKNLIATNLFVYHKHGGSFNTEEKEKLSQDHLRVILSEYHNYLKEVDLIKNDLKYNKTRATLLAFLISTNSKENVMVFNHNKGGGADSFIENKILQEKNKKMFLVVKNYEKIYTITIRYKEHKIFFMCNKISELEIIFKEAQINTIILNELVDYENVMESLHQIIDFKKKFNCRLIYFAHDFFCLCPSINLIESSGKWCNGGNDEICRQCFPIIGKKYVIKDKTINIDEWRKNWEALLFNCDKIYCFSKFTRSMFLEIMNNHLNIEIYPMPVTKFRKIELKRSDEINIGVLGSISFSKGANILYEMGRLLNKERKKYHDTSIKIIGTIDMKYSHKKLEVLGPYNKLELPSIVEKNNICIIFIPSIWGETYSYTTQEAIEMGIPIAVFNIGAPAERVSKYDKGLIIEKIDAEFALNQIIDYVKNNNE
jgi:GT2 family glycosyltransferase